MMLAISKCFHPKVHYTTANKSTHTMFIVLPGRYECCATLDFNPVPEVPLVLRSILGVSALISSFLVTELVHSTYN
eukprot:6469314-Amphidinium_carterae.1